MTRPTDTLPADYFAGIYASEADPWGFTTSAYERDKYAATLAGLPRDRYRSAFEPACSIGVLTRALAARCDRLLATEMVEAALDAARARCADCPGVTFRRGAVPAEWPEGRFDLIVLSEFLYFLSREDLVTLVARVGGAIEPGGDIVLVHWLGPTDYPLTGDEAAEGFIAGAAGFATVIGGERRAEYRLDLLRARA